MTSSRPGARGLVPVSGRGSPARARIAWGCGPAPRVTSARDPHARSTPHAPAIAPHFRPRHAAIAPSMLANCSTSDAP